MSQFTLRGLTKEHVMFLKNYAEQRLGTSVLSKAILALINEKMSIEQAAQGELVPEQNLTVEKKKRIQFSLREHDYNNLVKIAKETDCSIQHYTTRLILNDIYSDNIKLLGSEIEQLRKSNYELHMIGVNINQIAKALNAGEKVSFNLENYTKGIKEHLLIVRNILASNMRKY